jgi:hypothetical protein
MASEQLKAMNELYAAHRPQAESEIPTPMKDVLERHLKCFGETNLESILADHAPEAILFTPGGMLKGPRSNKALFQTLFSEFEKPGFSIAMERKAVEGDYAYILFGAETADSKYESATDTFVVRGGKIVAQSFAAKVTPKR